MNKTTLIVPEGIRFISDWKDYNLDDYQFPHILNKTITGCGFTEYCINCPDNVIICSPRKILLENKESQHQGEVFYAKSGVDSQEVVNYEKDLFTIKPPKEIIDPLTPEEKAQRILDFQKKIFQYFFDCLNSGKPCKILVTYDSFRHVKEALGDYIFGFQVVIDEFQSIFVDAKFKSDTELGFLYQLQGLQKVCFVSATPMMDKYLERLEEFKDLPYFDLDWESAEPGRTKKPDILMKTYTRGLTEEISKVIWKYLEGKFDKRYLTEDDGSLREIESKEAVIYVNSVKSICSVIKKCGLTLDNTNVLCARTPDNEKNIREAFNTVLRKLYPTDKSKRVPKGVSALGFVPRRGEAHKMFTLCTRTVYLGADFYSTCARSFVFSDANIDCLAVDVSMDLEQILGRQRLDENPWKNSANVFIKLQLEELTKEDFDKNLQRKTENTNSLLLSYSTSPTPTSKHILAKKYEEAVKAYNYTNDYIAVNKYSGSDVKPVFNNLMLVAEERAYEVQQLDYKDRFSIFNSLSKVGNTGINHKLDMIVSQFESYGKFIDRMKFLCDQEGLLSAPEYDSLLSLVSGDYENYIRTLGVSEIRSVSYQKSKIISLLKKKISNNQNKTIIADEIYKIFSEGGRHTKSDIKETLRSLYQKLGYQRTPKATDLQEYFELKSILTTEKGTGKRIVGFELGRRLL